MASFSIRFCLSCQFFAVLTGVTVAQPPSQAGRVVRDISYLGEDRSEKADLYLPVATSTQERAPVVLVVHGGGWIGGDKAAKREINICTTLAANGYAALSINYFLGPKDNLAASWPQNIRDCKAAVRWLRRSAESYGIDSERIGAIGGSAGGHLVSLLGVTGDGAAFEGTLNPTETSGRVSAVVDLYGPIQLGLGALDAVSDHSTSPLTYLDKNDPPFLIVHGTADTTVAIERSREFAAALAGAGIAHQLVVLDGAPHTFDLQPAQRDLRPLVLMFFNRHLKP